MGAQKALIVEDEQIVAFDLEDRLAAMGYAVVGIAADGSAAIERVRKQVPDVVLMDVKLPGGLDGIDTALRIRNEFDVPIVFLTAFGDSATRSRARNAAPYGYVLKPFQTRDLEIALEMALSRHTREVQVRRGEHRLIAALSSMADAVIATDRDGTVEFMNAGAEALLGLRSDQARGKRIEHALRVGSPRAVAAAPVTIEELVTADGEELFVESRARAVRDDQGAIDGMVWVFRDVTARKRAEHREHLLVRANALADSLDDAAIVEALERLVLPHLGDWYALESLQGPPQQSVDLVTHVAHVDPGRAAALRWLLEQRAPGVPLAFPDSVTFEAVAGAARLAQLLSLEAHPELEHLPTQSLLRIPLVARGEALGLLTIGAAHRLHDELDARLGMELGTRLAAAIDNAHRYQTAQRAVQVSEEMLGIVSHDLRTPLTTVIGQGELLLEGATTQESETLQRRARAIVRAGERMSHLVNDLLDAASIEAGQLALAKRDVAVAELMVETLEAFETRAADASVQLIAGPTVDACVYCDRNRVLQVLANLVDNAIKFTPRGGSVTIQLKLAGGEVVFAISDEGPGIPPDQRSQIFERYWRGPGAAGRGAGLGLYIARRVVEAHEGRIWAAARLRRGTSFHFTLPASALSEVKTRVARLRSGRLRRDGRRRRPGVIGRRTLR